MGLKRSGHLLNVALGKKMPKNLLLVDGYNLIHRSERLKRLLSRSREKAQVELIKEVYSWLGKKEAEAYIVFDAYESPYPTRIEEDSPLLKIVYTGRGKTADSFIEEFIFRNKERYRKIWVVTSDRTQISTVVGENVFILSPQTFLEEQKSSLEPSCSFSFYLFDGLSPGEREKLEKLRRGKK